MSALSGKWKFVPYEDGPNWGESLNPWTRCLYGVKEIEPAEWGAGQGFAEAGKSNGFLVSRFERVASR
jgi:hypothetical protein